MSELMQGAVLFGAGDIRILDVPRPEPDDSGAIVDVRSVGVCGTDLHTYKTGIFIEMSQPVAGGHLFGHEFAGELTHLPPGDEWRGFQLGDRVAGLAIGAYSQSCRCGSEFLGKPGLFKLPDHISFDEGATIEPLTVSLSAVRRAEPKPGDRVLIMGAGMIGLGCVQILSALYPECEVSVVDVSDKRLEMARTFGAHHVLNARSENPVAAIKSESGERAVAYNATSSGRMDIVLECAGLELTAQQSLELVRPNVGRLILVALYEQTPSVDLNQIVTKNLDVRGLLAYTHDDFLEALQLMSDGKVDRKPLITHRFPLAETAAAFEAQINTAETLKAVIQP
ncbi:MAG: zinc-binding dehydrogenase [Pseudomonadaceae bacterium]|nr:zinc-binding dehydrogenase [Pseudomonadaceae bacterium]